MWPVSLLLIAMAIPTKVWIESAHRTVSATAVVCTDGRNRIEIVGSDCEALNNITPQPIVICADPNAGWSVASGQQSQRVNDKRCPAPTRAWLIK